MSRSPLAATDDDIHADARLIEPKDVDVYPTGASEVQRTWRRNPPAVSLGRLELGRTGNPPGRDTRENPWSDAKDHHEPCGSASIAVRLATFHVHKM